MHGSMTGRGRGTGLGMLLVCRMGGVGKHLLTL